MFKTITKVKEINGFDISMEVDESTTGLPTIVFMAVNGITKESFIERKWKDLMAKVKKPKILECPPVEGFYISDCSRNVLRLKSTRYTAHRKTLIFDVIDSTYGRSRSVQFNDMVFSLVPITIDTEEAFRRIKEDRASYLTLLGKMKKDIVTSIKELSLQKQPSDGNTMRYKEVN